jgi:hypothetical protein
MKKKVVLRNVGNFEVYILIKKHMSADDIPRGVSPPQRLA